jgi:hypothetical protein
VVFVHGVTGDPLGTWVQGDVSGKFLDPTYIFDLSLSLSLCYDNPYFCSIYPTIVWPRDWLPQDVPEARVLSIGFELFLSKVCTKIRGFYFVV